MYGPPEVDKIWLWVYKNEIPIDPIFYVLKGDYVYMSGCIWLIVNSKDKCHPPEPLATLWVQQYVHATCKRRADMQTN